jgi:hypothetical protein
MFGAWHLRAPTRRVDEGETSSLKNKMGRLFPKRDDDEMRLAFFGTGFLWNLDLKLLCSCYCMRCWCFKEIGGDLFDRIFKCHLQSWSVAEPVA